MTRYITMGLIYVIGGCVIAVLSFYHAYSVHSCSPKDSNLASLLLKSIKFAAALLLLLIVFTASLFLCKHFHIGFWISFMISVLISLGFLVCYYLFDIKNPAFSNDSTKKVKKKNEAMDDLQRKLSNRDCSDIQ